MAGRGRGINRRPDDKQCEPLRRPGAKPVTKENEDDELAINDKLQRLHLDIDLKTPANVNIVSQSIKEEVNSVSDLKSMVATLLQFAIRGRQQASVAAQVLQELRHFNHEQTKFLTEFLNTLQQYFSAGDFSDTSKFVRYLTLLCETYYHLGREGSNPLTFLKPVILGYLQKLLASGSDLEITTFVELILKLCTDFNDNEWNDIMISVRRNIISSKCSEKSRSSLLQLFELYLRNWTPLSKDTNAVYNSYQ